MHISRLEPDHPLWQALAAHLAANGDAHWVLDEGGRPKNDSLVFLAAQVDEQIVPLPEVLRGNYISYHLPSCFIGYAGFLVSFVALVNNS